jgi:sulfhydrogenase subunit beta (sulfur reductase)
MTDPVRILHRRDFQHLLNALASRGYRIVGPTVRDGAIVYDEIHAASDLPEGWTDRQDGGILFHRYRFSSIR